MKKLMMIALCALAANVATAAEVVFTGQIGALNYTLFDDGDAQINSADKTAILADLVVGTVEHEGKSYTVRQVQTTAFKGCTTLKSFSAPFVDTISPMAFVDCTSLEMVSVPLVTKISKSSLGFPGVFSGCTALTSLTVSSELAKDWESEKSQYGIDGVNVNPIVKFALTKEHAELAVWEAEATALVKTLKVGDIAISAEDYEYACDLHGLQPKPEPPDSDFKVVSADAQVVQKGEVAVQRTEIQAAKAETVTVAGGTVTLGVTVNTNGNVLAATKDWQPVELKPENVSVVDGKIVITLPVDSPSGFMILQSSDAFVSASALIEEANRTLQLAEESLARVQQLLQAGGLSIAERVELESRAKKIAGGMEELTEELTRAKNTPSTDFDARRKVIIEYCNARLKTALGEPLQASPII